MFTFPLTLFGVEPFVNTLSTSFDGVDERIDVPDDNSFDVTSISVFLWIKSGTVDPFVRQVIIGRNRITQAEVCWSIEVLNTNQIRIRIYEDISTEKTYRIPANLLVMNGNWHQIGFTYSQSTDTLTLYADGAAVVAPVKNVDNAMPAGLNIVAQRMDIGCGSNGAASNPVLFFDGNIDEVSIWNRALTLGEIGLIYNSGTPTNLANISFFGDCITWYRMGDGDNATTIFDQKSSNDGSLINMNAGNYETDVPP